MSLRNLERFGEVRPEDGVEKGVIVGDLDLGDMEFRVGDLVVERDMLCSFNTCFDLIAMLLLPVVVECVLM